MDWAFVAVSALTLACIYGLLALGVSIVFSSLGMINMAHGLSFALAGYGAWLAATHVSDSAFVVLAAGIATGALSGLLIGGVAFIPLHDKPNFIVRSLVATLAMSLLGAQGLLWLFGPNAKSLPALFGQTNIQWAGLSLPPDKLGAIACSLALMGATLLWMVKSRAGLAIRAMMQNPEGAALVGMPGATRDQVIATGFNRNHRGNTEDGIVAEEYAVEYVVDRVETTSAVFLGMTMGCARCHNHKYDPLTQKEFYQFFAYFNNVPENGRAMKYGNSPPYVQAPTAEQQAKLAALEAAIAAEEKAVREVKAEAGTSAWVPQAALEVTWAGGEKTFEPKEAFFDIRDHFTLSANVTMNEGSLLAKMGKEVRDKGYGVHVRQGKLFVNFTSSWDTDAIKIESVRTFAPGERHHLTVTYDGTVSAAGFQLFVDGQPEPMKIHQDNLYRPLVNAGGIFKQPLRASANTKDVRIYSRVLEEEERLALAQPGDARFARQAYLEHAAQGAAAEAWKRRNANPPQRACRPCTCRSAIGHVHRDLKAEAEVGGAGGFPCHGSFLCS